MFESPAHPYTRALLASIPRVSRGEHAREREPLGGEVPSPARPPSGCRFHPRCSLAFERCPKERPELYEVSGWLEPLLLESVRRRSSLSDAERVASKFAYRLGLVTMRLYVAVPWQNFKAAASLRYESRVESVRCRCWCGRFTASTWDA
ncbi:MAG: oligopeptide/dipeptide ABC transporter ATP-binding protein [Pseudomonadota bacterium]